MLHALFLAAAVAATTPPPSAAVIAVIQASARDWNAGDLDGFMRSYEDSPDTVFVTKAGPVRGYKTIHDRYQKNYGGKPSGALGQLSFTDLDVRPMGARWAVAYGRFHLVTDAGKPEQTGVFDLIFHKTPAGWRIASDHTS